MNGILEMEDFSEDYKLIESKLAVLENKRIDALDFDKEAFNLLKNPPFQGCHSYMLSSIYPSVAEAC